MRLVSKGRSGRKSSLTPLMSEDRILAIIDRCWEMHSLGYFDREIIEEITKEFELPKAPTRSMVLEWLQKGRTYTSKNLLESQERYVNKAMGVLDHLLRKWIPVAVVPNLALTKTHMVDGMKEAYTDENCYDEQIKAATLVAKLLKEGRDILGIGNNTTNLDAEAIDRAGILALIQQSNTFIMTPSDAKTIDIKTTGHEVLEMESGLEDEK